MANIFSNLFDFVKNGVSGINQIAYEMGLPEGEAYGKSLLDKQKMELLRLQQQKEAAELVPAQFRAEILQKSRDNVTKAANGGTFDNSQYFNNYFTQKQQPRFQLSQQLPQATQRLDSKGGIDPSQFKLTIGKQQVNPTDALAQGSSLDPNSNVGKPFYNKTQYWQTGDGKYHYITPNWLQTTVDPTTGQRSDETKGISGFNFANTNSGNLYEVADLQNGIQLAGSTKDKVNNLTQDFYNTFGQIPVISHNNNNGIFFTSKTFNNKQQDWLKQKANSLGLTTGDMTDKGLSLIDSSVERNNQLNTNFSGDYAQGVEPVVRAGNKVTTSNDSLDSFMNALGEQESGGNYYTNHNSSGAMGKYQILKTNWPTWAEEAGLSRDASMTPENQETVARHKVQEYYKQFGNWKDVATAWYAGPGEVQSPTFDHSSELNNGPSVSRYVNEVMGKMGKTTTSEPVYKNQAQPNDYLQSVTDISQNFDSDNPANSIDNLRNNYLKYRNTGKIELGKLNNDALYTLQQWGVENPESIINSWNDDITKSNISQMFNKGQQSNPDFQFSTVFKNGLDLNAPNKTINIPGMGYENAMRQYGSVILNELLNDKASAGYYMNPQQQQQSALIKNKLALSAEEQLQAQQEKQKTIIDVLNKIIGGLDSNTKTIGQYGADQQQTDQFERLLNSLGMTIGINPNIHIKPAYGTKNEEIDISKFNANTGRMNADTNRFNSETNRANYFNNLEKTKIEATKVSNQIEQTNSLKINDKIKLKQEWDMFTQLASGKNVNDPVTGSIIEGCHSAEDFTNLEAKYRSILASIAKEGIPVAGTLEYYEKGWSPKWIKG